MSEILDRTAYQRPTSFSEVRGDPARDDDRRASFHPPDSARPRRTVG